MEYQDQSLSRPSGPALAALLAAGFGVATLGVATFLASASASVNDLLNWWSPVGPLAGKSGLAVIAWLMAWAGLHLAWRGREVPFRPAWTLTLVLIALGWLLTFPPVFEAVAPH